MDESNEKTDKSCIIMARFLDPSVGEVRTRSMDMPVVNIGVVLRQLCSCNAHCTELIINYVIIASC